MLVLPKVRDFLLDSSSESEEDEEDDEDMPLKEAVALVVLLSKKRSNLGPKVVSNKYANTITS